ncbi:hypothetical protein OSTOST_04573 [Ostertagia ostertagi]
MTSSSSLVPDVSRVFVAHSSLGDPKWSNALFVRPRSVSQENTVLSRDFRTETAYDTSMTSQIAAAPKIPLNAVECGAWKQQMADISSTSNSTSVVITCGSEMSDVAVRAVASRCFGLYFDQHFATGVYKRVIRFVHM